MKRVVGSPRARSFQSGEGELSQGQAMCTVGLAEASKAQHLVGVGGVEEAPNASDPIVGLECLR
jgi:hypothetical protein